MNEKAIVDQSKLNRLLGDVGNVTLIGQAIEGMTASGETKRKYLEAIIIAVNAGVNIGDAEQLRDYAANLGGSQRAHLKAAISVQMDHIDFLASNMVNPDNVGAVQAVKIKCAAIKKSIKVQKVSGSKFHTWLTLKQMAMLFTHCCDHRTTKGRRDNIALAILVHCGLRRTELTKAEFSHVVTQDNMTYINVIGGKGGKSRAVPIASGLKSDLDKWANEIGPGKIIRSITQTGIVGESISSVGIFNIVSAAGRKIDIEALAPHDLRRTFAQHCYENGYTLTQIMTLLGHESLETTKKYLQIETIFDLAPGETMPYRSAYEVTE